MRRMPLAWMPVVLVLLVAAGGAAADGDAASAAQPAGAAGSGQQPAPEQPAPEQPAPQRAVTDSQHAVAGAACAVSAAPAEPAVPDLLGTPEPIALGCMYPCGICPDMPDMPPATCVDGCCTWEVRCTSACTFDSDCGELASCWEGCCYSWVH